MKEEKTALDAALRTIRVAKVRLLTYSDRIGKKSQNGSFLHLISDHIAEKSQNGYFLQVDQNRSVNLPLQL